MALKIKVWVEKQKYKMETHFLSQMRKLWLNQTKKIIDVFLKKKKKMKKTTKRYWKKEVLLKKIKRKKLKFYQKLKICRANKKLLKTTQFEPKQKNGENFSPFLLLIASFFLILTLSFVYSLHFFISQFFFVIKRSFFVLFFFDSQ